MGSALPHCLGHAGMQELGSFDCAYPTLVPGGCKTKGHCSKDMGSQSDVLKLAGGPPACREAFWFSGFGAPRHLWESWESSEWSRGKQAGSSSGLRGEGERSGWVSWGGVLGLFCNWLGLVVLASGTETPSVGNYMPGSLVEGLLYCCPW